MKSVICDSGVMGYQCKLQENYDDFAQFKHYSGLYNLAERLGYKSAIAAWKDNPIIQGSTIPSDFRKIEDSK